MTSSETPLAKATRRVPFSNGHEYDAWTSKWCAYCVHEHEVHEGRGPGCEIVCSVLLVRHGIDWRWPEPWVPEPDDGENHLPSRLICGQFEPCAECGGDPEADTRAERVAEVTAYWRFGYGDHPNPERRRTGWF